MTASPDRFEAIRRASALQDPALIERACREILTTPEACARPENKPAVTALAQALSAQGRMAEAIAPLEAALRSSPTSPAVRNLLATAYLVGGRWDGAIALLEALSRQTPNTADLKNLAVAYANAGRGVEAVTALRTAIKLSPSDQSLHYRLGALALKLWMFPLARESLERVVTLTPNNIDARVGLAVALNRLGERRAALEHVESVLRLNPEMPNAHETRATILLDLGRHEEGLSAFRAAITCAVKKQDRVAYHLAWAQALKRVGQTTDALDALRALLSDEPGNLVARHLLAAWGGASEAHPNPKYVETLFNEYAEIFDAHLVEELNYIGPEQATRLLLEIGAGSPGSTNSAPRMLERIIDVGCGTGLGVLALKQHFTIGEAVGIDLSGKMLVKAGQTGAYARLIHGEAVRALSELRGNFAVALALEVFIYIGDLSPIMQEMTAALKPGGLMVFTTESADTPTFILQDNGRCGHGIKYVESLAALHGLTLMRAEPTALRRHAGGQANGHIWVFRKDSQ
jgi:predicted TPR repeat methyltransferase